jgi:hypothetical protein
MRIYNTVSVFVSTHSSHDGRCLVIYVICITKTSDVMNIAAVKAKLSPDRFAQAGLST